MNKNASCQCQAARRPADGREAQQHPAVSSQPDKTKTAAKGKRFLHLYLALCLGSAAGPAWMPVMLAADETDGWETLSGKVPESDRQKSALAHYKKGKEFHRQQNYRAAVKEYQRALGLNPNLSQARQALNWAQRDLKRQKTTEKPGEYTLENLVADAKEHYQRGRRYEREKKPLEAVSAYKDALRLIPGYPEAKEALRRVQSQAQRSLAPLPYSATAASAKAPQAHEPLNLSPPEGTLKNIKPRGSADTRPQTASQKNKLVQDQVTSAYIVPSSRQQRPSEDQQAIRGAIQKHYLVGCQLLDQGDFATAIKEFELILEFEPEHREAQYKRNVAKKRQAAEVKAAQRNAELARSKGDTLGALSALRDIVNIDPNNEEALEAWERTKQENKGLVDEIYRKGVNAYAKGEYNAALQAWELALDMDPKHAKAQESIKKVRQKMELIK
ncbi:tetratricopeptide repeat protein [candidate division FCPU426 bacterium]|nr:tetratricopeptide repeat protein [candidate division FCPU426 bacterium]